MICLILRVGTGDGGPSRASATDPASSTPQAMVATTKPAYRRGWLVATVTDVLKRYFVGRDC
jgi:hypothetical protein